MSNNNKSNNQHDMSPDEQDALEAHLEREAAEEQAQAEAAYEAYVEKRDQDAADEQAQAEAAYEAYIDKRDQDAADEQAQAEAAYEAYIDKRDQDAAEEQAQSEAAYEAHLEQQTELQVQRQKEKEALVDELIEQKNEQEREQQAVLEKLNYEEYRESVYQDYMFEKHPELQWEEENQPELNEDVLSPQMDAEKNAREERNIAAHVSGKLGKGRISSITIENFKGIGEKVTIPLKPITLLFGANSAGKSTVLQAMLYAHEVLNNRNPDADVTEFGGEKINLGGFRNLVHGHDLSKTIKIGFEYVLSDDGLPPYGLKRAVSEELADNLNNQPSSISQPAKTFVEFTVQKPQDASFPFVSQYTVCMDGQPVASIRKRHFNEAAYLESLTLDCLDYSGDGHDLAVQLSELEGIAHKYSVAESFQRQPLGEQLAQMQSDCGKRLHDHKEDCVEAFSNVFLGEKIPLDVVNMKTRDVIIPPNRKITKTLLRKLVENFEHVEVDPSPIRIKIMGVLDNYKSLIQKYAEFDRHVSEFLSRTDELSGHLKSLLHNEKIPLDIVNRETGDVIVPANRKITLTLLRKLVENFDFVEIDPSPIRIKVMSVIGGYKAQLSNLRRRHIELFLSNSSKEKEVIRAESTLDYNDERTLPVWGEILPFKEYIGDLDVHETVEAYASLSSIIVGPGELIAKELKQMRYIGPIREIPSRNYTPQNTVVPRRWADGMAGWDILLNDVIAGEEWFDRAGYDKLNLGYEFVRRVSMLAEPKVLQGLLSKQMSLSEAAEAVDRLQRFAHIKNTVEMRDVETGTDVEPCDVGTGVSQVIPVVAGAMAPGCRYLTVEQPELHLHPAIQCNLGDLFISQMHRYQERTFLLETHSEHLILRLLRRIRETSEGELEDSSLSLTPDQVAILYIEEIDNGVAVCKMEISKEGDLLTPWPNGFFPERMTEILGG